jgi:hypothetical protein
VLMPMVLLLRGGQIMMSGPGAPARAHTLVEA